MTENDKQEEGTTSAYDNWWGQWRLALEILTGRYRAGDKRLLERVLMGTFVIIRCFSLSNFKWLCGKDSRKARFIDIYVLVKLGVLIFLLRGYPTVQREWLQTLIAGIVWYIIVDTLNYVLCVVFVDMHEKGWLPVSYSGSLILLIVNYVQIVIGFAVLYLYTEAIGYADSEIAISTPLEGFYFSTVTITTVGYGDMRPICSGGKWLVSVETLVGIVLLALVLNAILVKAGITNAGAGRTAKEDDK